MYYLIFDLETTGLPIGKGRFQIFSHIKVVEIAWQLFNQTGYKILEDSYIILPENYSIPEDSIRIHGITNEKAKELGKKRSFVYPKFLNILKEFHPILVAHNIEFDFNVLSGSHELEDYQDFVEFQKLPQICTMKSSTSYCKCPPYRRGSYKWPSLEELHYKLFNHNFEDSHHALSDVQATAKCLFELFRLNIIKQTSITVSTAPINNKLPSTIPIQPPSFVNSSIKQSYIMREKKRGKPWPWIIFLILTIIVYGFITPCNYNIFIKCSKEIILDPKATFIVQFNQVRNISVDKNYSSLTINKFGDIVFGFRNGYIISNSNDLISKFILEKNIVIISTAISMDCQSIFVGFTNGDMRIYKFPMMNLMIEGKKSNSFIISSYFIGNDTLVTIDDNNVLSMWQINLSNFYLLKEIKIERNSYVRSISYNHILQKYFLGLDNGELITLNKNLEIINTYMVHDGSVNSITINEKNDIIITTGQDYRLKIWYENNSKVVNLYDSLFNNQILAAEFSNSHSFYFLTKSEILLCNFNWINNEVK